MLLLQSMDRFDDLAELNTSTGQISWFSRRADPTAASRPVRGHIAQLQGRTLCLYREAGILHFRVDDIDIELTEDTCIELVRGKTNVLTVLRGDVPIFCLEYRPYMADETDKWRMYLDPFIEEEDFDFGLFVYNTVKDVDRRDRIYR